MLASGSGRACALRAGGARASGGRASGVIACWGHHEETDDFAPVDLAGTAPAAPPPLAIVPHGGAAGPLCARWPAGWFCHNGFEWFPRPPNLATADRHFKLAGLRMRQIADDEACGVDQTGRLTCAGCTRGDCTRASARAALTAFAPGAPARTPGARFSEATALYNHGDDRFVCGGTESGRVRCYHAGKAPFEKITDPAPVAEPTIDALTDVVQIQSGDGGDRNEAGGDGFACALRRAGDVWCWGSGRFGQLGVAPVAWRAAAAPVEGMPPAAEIAIGRTFACARARAKEGAGPGQVYCWGSNRDGGVPDGSAGAEAGAVAVAWP